MNENKYKVDFPATYDPIFYNTFANTEALAELSSEIIQTSFLPSDIILSSQKIAQGIKFKASNFDIRYSMLDMDIDLEMQREKPNYNMADRLTYYLAQLTSESLVRGQEYQYKRCCVICFTNFPLFASKECVKHFIMREDSENIIIRGMEIYTIDLTNKENCANIKLRRWLELMTAKDLREFRGKNEIMDKAVERIVESNEDEEIRDMIIRQKKDEFIRRLEAAEAKKQKEELAAIKREKEEVKRQREELERQKAEAHKEKAEAEKRLAEVNSQLVERQSQMTDAIEKSKAEGLHEGLQAGIEKGLQQGKTEIAKRLLAMELSMEEVSKATGLTLEEIQTL